MLDNGVRVVLLGHSMGGIVAAEAILAIAGKTPTIASSSAAEPSSSAKQVRAQDEQQQKDISKDSTTEAQAQSAQHEGDSIHFPHIYGLLAFDTPYLGLAPSMISHGAETHWNTGKSIYTTANSLWTSFRSSSPNTSGSAAKAPIGALPAPSAADAGAASASAGAWSSWGKMALYGTAAASIAGAGAAAAYFNRQTIGEGVSTATSGLTEGWTWVTSHLEFVGCLARAEELQRRLAGLCALCDSSDGAAGAVEKASDVRQTRRTLGFANFYTVLGKAAAPYAGGKAASENGERRFCNLPRSDQLKRFWTPAKNDMAKDEVTAHITMFTPDENPDYYRMIDRARDMLVQWTDREWYQGSQAEAEQEDIQMTG